MLINKEKEAVRVCMDLGGKGALKYSPHMDNRLSGRVYVAWE